jgi:hypothetical protein
MSEVDRRIQKVLKEWPVAVVRVQGHDPNMSMDAHEVERIDVCRPHRNDAERWVGASQTAGRWLDYWYSKHPIILKKIAPLLPTIIKVLKEADLNEIERLFAQAEAKARAKKGR